MSHKIYMYVRHETLPNTALVRLTAMCNESRYCEPIVCDYELGSLELNCLYSSVVNSDVSVSGLAAILYTHTHTHPHSHRHQHPPHRHPHLPHRHSHLHMHMYTHRHMTHTHNTYHFLDCFWEHLPHLLCNKSNMSFHRLTTHPFGS